MTISPSKQTGPATLYFAYGSNLDFEQMAFRCPTAVAGVRAVLPGHRFLINTHGVATVVPDANAQVEGLLWRLQPSDERSLDIYEGVARRLYHKRQVSVSSRDGNQMEALTYVAADGQPGPPRAGYLERIIASAQSLDFPEDYVNDLKEWVKAG